MFKKALFSILFVTLTATAAVAANNKGGSSPLSSEMKAFVVKKDKYGKELLQAAKQAEPGETIEYQLTYKNNGKTSLKGLAITGPIPADTRYLGKSAASKFASDLLVSIDGGKTFEKEPVKRKKKMENGKVEVITIPASQYTHVRWNVKSPLKAGSKQTYKYRVQVN